jgi:hypothetical protein
LLRNARELDLNSQEFIDRQLTKSPLTLPQFLNKIRKYAANCLFGAEAAQRTKEEELQWVVDKILNEWGAQYKIYFQNIKVYSTCADAYTLFHHIIPKMAKRIQTHQDYQEALAWQPLLSPELIPSALQRIEYIGKRIFILASKAESIQFENMPLPDLSTYSLISNRASRFFDILCYSYEITENYSFNKDQQKYIKNEDVINLLAHEKNLDVLDLSSCTSLTNECLSHGHEKLKKLNISHTYLEATEIDPLKFPSLQKITCTARKKGFFGSTPSITDRVYHLKFNKDKKIELALDQSMSDINLSGSLFQKIPDFSGGNTGTPTGEEVKA